jgi:hypothetical protein
MCHFTVNRNYHDYSNGPPVSSLGHPGVSYLHKLCTKMFLELCSNIW